MLKCFYNHHNVLLLTPVLIKEWMNHMPLALTKECHLCKIKCVPLDSDLKRLEKQGDELEVEQEEMQSAVPGEQHRLGDDHWKAALQERQS